MLSLKGEVEKKPLKSSKSVEEKVPEQKKQVQSTSLPTKKVEEVKKPIKEKQVKTEVKKEIPQDQKKQPQKSSMDMASIRDEIRQELRGGKITKSEAVIKEQREPIKRSIPGGALTPHEKAHKDKERPDKSGRSFIKTGIEGLDELFDQGIPKGNSILIAGGAGSGKTILCLQTLAHHIGHNEKCLYVSFEERESKLIEHMEGFGWPAKDYIKKGNLKILRMNPFDITRNVDALLAKQKGELLIDIDPIIWPKGFEKPNIIVIDSLTSIGSAFTGKEDSY